MEEVRKFQKKKKKVPNIHEQFHPIEIEWCFQYRLILQSTEFKFKGHWGGRKKERERERKKLGNSVHLS